MIKTLKEVGTNNILYPKTDVSAVLKENGESIEANLIPGGGSYGQILQYTENGVSWDYPFENYTDLLAYGVEWDVTVADPTCTRVGNMSLHKTLPIQSQMRGCLLDDDGKVVRYLDPNDWTSEVRDGSEGQVMVEIPMHYFRFITNGTKRRAMISEFPLPGYKQIPLQYVSAYQASLQRSTSKLASVVNDTADYRGGGNQDSYDGTSATLLGRPATSISRTNFRNYARNRKTGSTEWNCMTYQAQKTIFWLFAIEYATLNTQEAYNAEPTAEGYKQGGLGAGVTNINVTKWNAFNGYNPFIPCGYTDELGNGTGIKVYDMPTDYSENTVSVQVPRYRGIENPFGHIWQWTDGINIRISPTTDNGGDGLSKVYVCEDPSKFKDNGYDGYSHVGNEARTNGYVKEIIGGEGGEIMPEVVGGSSTTYFCDNHWTNIPTIEELRGVLFGGYAFHGASAGLAFARSSNSPSNASAYFGSRLCFVPRQAE